ncbi:MAG: hypothetical protein R3281_08270 [Balneolaceae bacterium]|nr:hypothetical protein [Balneolaceae bacterium]
MRKLLTITLLCATITLTAELAHAQDEGFGIGAMINGPTGISYKAWINEDIAIGGAVTFNISENFSSFYTHADVLMHGTGENGSFNMESGDLRLYYGGGVRLTFDDFSDDTDFGIRVPVGTVYQFEDTPADVFFEFVPTILFNDFNFGFDGALGFRYYLN